MYSEGLKKKADMKWVNGISITLTQKQLSRGVKKVVLRNFAKFTGKDLCQILFLMKLQALTCIFIKKRDSDTGFLL